MTPKRGKNRKQLMVSRRARKRIALTISILTLVAITYWASRGQDSSSVTPTPLRVLSERSGEAVRSLPPTLVARTLCK